MEWRSASMIFRPFGSTARCTAGKLTWGVGPTAGIVLRSTLLGTALSAGYGRTSRMYTPSESQRTAVSLTLWTVASSICFSDVL